MTVETKLGGINLCPIKSEEQADDPFQGGALPRDMQDECNQALAAAQEPFSRLLPFDNSTHELVTATQEDDSTKKNSTQIRKPKNDFERYLVGGDKDLNIEACYDLDKISRFKIPKNLAAQTLSAMAVLLKNGSADDISMTDSFHAHLAIPEKDYEAYAKIKATVKDPTKVLPEFLKKHGVYLLFHTHEWDEKWANNDPRRNILVAPDGTMKRLTNHQMIGRNTAVKVGNLKMVGLGDVNFALKERGAFKLPKGDYHRAGAHLEMHLRPEDTLFILKKGTTSVEIDPKKCEPRFLQMWLSYTEYAKDYQHTKKTGPSTFVDEVRMTQSRDQYILGRMSEYVDKARVSSIEELKKNLPKLSDADIELFKRSFHIK